MVNKKVKMTFIISLIINSFLIEMITIADRRNKILLSVAGKCSLNLNDKSVEFLMMCVNKEFIIYQRIRI